MNKQTLYIILIIALFNFLLINIFRLQRDITNIRDKTDKVKQLSSKPISKPQGYIKPNNNKQIGNIDNNNNGTGVVSGGVKEVMNEISKLVPIDVNKIYPSKEKFVPKSVQVKTI